MPNDLCQMHTRVTLGMLIILYHPHLLLHRCNECGSTVMLCLKRIYQFVIMPAMINSNIKHQLQLRKGKCSKKTNKQIRQKLKIKIKFVLSILLNNNNNNNNIILFYFHLYLYLQLLRFHLFHLLKINKLCLTKSMQIMTIHNVTDKR